MLHADAAIPTGQIMAGTLIGETAIVTGAGRGFGAAIAKGLAAEGANVVLVSRTGSELRNICEAVVASGGKACVAEADVTSRPDVERAVAAAEAAFGPVSLLVSNAGIAGPFGPIGVLDPDAWWQAQAVHLRGPLLFLSALLPGMRARKRGRIIIVSARAANLVTAHLSAYGMGKASQIRLVQHVSTENLDYGLSAFAIEPGTAITELAEGTIGSPDAQRWLPGMLESLSKLKKEQPDPAPVFVRCAQMCVALASGRYDALTGRYLEPKDDFDALLRDWKTP
jgi:NAD(P)-dependent dehydrogenase (short-subunit alcohol dehydrogenase family)